jgi:hypothetical protein
MSSIYTLATRVVAWIGEEENESSLAMKTMKEIGGSIVVNWLRPPSPWPPSSFQPQLFCLATLSQVITILGSPSAHPAHLSNPLEASK